MLKGTVKWYRRELGLGMITPDTGSDDVLFRGAVVEGDDSLLMDGTRVEYAARASDEGPVATRIVIP